MCVLYLSIPTHSAAQRRVEAGLLSGSDDAMRVQRGNKEVFHLALTPQAGAQRGAQVYTERYRSIRGLDPAQHELYNSPSRSVMTPFSSPFSPSFSPTCRANSHLSLLAKADSARMCPNSSFVAIFRIDHPSVTNPRCLPLFRPPKPSSIDSIELHRPLRAATGPPS